MCRLSLQLLGMLGNVLGRPRHALQRPWHALQGPWPTSTCFMFCNALGMLCKVLGPPWHAFVRSYGSLVVHYSLGFIAYKAASEGVSLRCVTPRTLQKHAKVG